MITSCTVEYKKIEFSTVFFDELIGKLENSLKTMNKSQLKSPDLQRFSCTLMYGSALVRLPLAIFLYAVKLSNT